ncbi:MAG TPA: aldehyde dehydrogenase [Paracoccus solventivorans]|uniref:Aldehyde dehydrogenase n=1 Tax=Paracoccus solventivorans TaxID=53463 RepID=A0A832PJK2_9RHOB|nr:aldehyde dehydrogenase [Paracoccus solventivorans]HHW32539.1 aldehyde dehydrogenase [Paracoccus solventivorans]
MTGLLTTAEYKSIAAGLSFPTLAFIDGEFRPAASGKTFTTINPATGEALAEVAACDAQDVDAAVAAARAAFDDGRWSRLHPGERKETLLRLAVLMEENARELAVLESLDAGKTIFDCETVDVPETIHVIKWHAELIDKIYDQVSPASDNHIAMVVREPVGVVGLVLPWNFPLLMLAWKIGPALAAGCSVVMKPASETTLTALRVAELAAEAGLPAGVLNIVTGSGREVGEPLGRHPDVDMVSFTGSTVTGRRFLTYSADSNLKEVVLELGGKNPCIVLDDAEDLEAVAGHVVNGAFWNMGQNCSAASRLIVQRGIKDRLLEKVRAEAAGWLVGDPLDPSVRVGALISKSHFDKVAGYLDAAQAETVLMGGNVVSEGFIEPTIVETARDSKLAVEEIFGPILTVIAVDSFDEAIRVANDTEYGLAASIFSANGKRALRGARLLRAGTVTVNSFGEGDVTTPFGGYKQSGFGGRDNSIHAHDQYTQLKTIWLDLAAGDDGDLD